MAKECSAVRALREIQEEIPVLVERLVYVGRGRPQADYNDGVQDLARFLSTRVADALNEVDAGQHSGGQDGPSE